MIIPKEVKLVIDKLRKVGFEAYIVGGCVRDILRKEKPKDWDITTNAKPEQVSKIFKKSHSENNLGTVTVLTGSKDETLKEIEITTYRTESKYSDRRHPDEVKFAKTIEEDLERRDFTINALAIDVSAKKKNEINIIDLFNGQEDLKNKIIRAVGDPEERFNEDALRMMRAVRFVSVLGSSWEIETKTKKAIRNNSKLLKVISKERIRDEFLKIIMSEKAFEGVETLRELRLLKHIIPEIEEGYKVGQNKHHIYDVYDHCLFSLKYAAKKNFSKEVRMASLLHDVGKPRSKHGEGEDSIFYNHEVIGAKMTKEILERLKFSKKDIFKITKLVRYHLFYYNVDEVGESSVRRLVHQVGIENMNELLEVRMCDRIGSNCPKAEPYKLRHMRYVIEKVSQDPISVKNLKIKGDEIMKILKINPGPKIGEILDILFGYVLVDPKKNKKEFFKKEVNKLKKLSDLKIKKLAGKIRRETKEFEMKKDQMTKKKYWVS